MTARAIIVTVLRGVHVTALGSLFGTLLLITALVPVWPLPWRPGTAAFEDPSLRRGLILARVTAGIGIVVVVAGLIWRRSRREAFFQGW